jgi:hypothetical protein
VAATTLKILPFESQFIVARKIEKVFAKKFARDEKKFYDSLVSRLFANYRLYELGNPHGQYTSG